MTKETFDVTGMSCSACSARVEKAVAKLVGADNVSVNLLTNSMQVTFDETITDAAQIIDAVVQAGYGASLKLSNAAQVKSSSTVRSIDKTVSDM